MKISCSWIVRGAIAAGIIAYAAMGDPLLDALITVQSLEQSAEEEPKFGDEKQDPSRMESMEGWKSRLVQQPGSGRFGREYLNESSRAHQRNQYATLRAFRESVGDKWKSTVQILEKNRQVALGTIVSQDGWIITKSSEVSNGSIEAKLYDGTKADATVKYRRNDFDLVLLKIERKDLPAIQWSISSAVRVGGWLATTDTRILPIAIGVMGVASRNVRREPARLGVELDPSDGGALVRNVTLGSGADRAGLQPGDLITTIDGDRLNSQPEVMSRLKGLMAGQRVDVGILRNGKKSLVTAQMMDLTNALLIDPTEMEVNGEISSRSTGFQNIIQHDSVIAPNQCGGPIVDVFGNAVGLNIARAGRVSSYAIPASVVSSLVVEMISSASGLKSPFEENVAQSPSNLASQRTTNALTNSVPNSISVEALKPEVVVPNVTRP